MPTLPNEQTPGKWWNKLEDQWKLAYSQAYFQQREIYTPTTVEIQQLLEAPVLRLASPGAYHPSMGFDLTNLSGLQGLKKLELLFVVHHQLNNLEEIAELTQLKQLVVYNNGLTSLCGIEKMLALEKLYVQENNLTSIKEIESLTQLQEFHFFKNPLASLDGLGPQHQDNMKHILAFPTESLSEDEIQRKQQQTGILFEKGSRR